MKTKNLITIALLSAISIILTRFFSVMIPLGGIMGLRISFGDIPIILTGLLFGPIAGAMAGAVSDVIGAVFLSPYGFFPGFTISAALVGAIPPLVMMLFKNKDMKIYHLFIAILVTDIVTSFFLNTLWLTMTTGKGFLVLLPPRLIARAILMPITTTLLYIVTKKVRILKLI
jgi:ECF transporter S component (folate family)